GGRISFKDVVPYIITQVIAATVAAAALYLVASGKSGFDAQASGFASNGFGAHSPDGYSMMAAIVIEILLTAFFLIVIHGATDKRAPAGFAPIAIGLCLTLIHLISIPVTNTSVNPARSTGVALFQGGWAIEQLWLFWLMPIIGGIVGGLIYRCLLSSKD
ncbi:MAG: aquaporin Z, partial [Saezia sp.]